MIVLDPLTFPLEGTRIIEASAGTGKTYTITSLYLRLLLGDDAPTEDLTADRILVVTFTDAATQELRDRIRGRVLALRQTLLTKEGDDDFTRGLLEKVAGRPDSLARLNLALQQMDEAAICTIHAFCYRILREHAFESGALFDYDYRIDDIAYRRLATTDFWRRLVYPLTGEELALVTGLWPSPEELWQAVAPYLMKPELELRGGDDEPFQEQSEHLRRAIERIKWCWRSEKVRTAIESSAVRKAKDRPGGAPMLERMDEWVRDDGHLLRVPGERGGPVSFDQLLRHYATDRLLAPRNLTKRGNPPDCEHFCGLVDVALASFRRLMATVLGHAIVEVSAAAIAEKLADRVLSPDDLLLQMDTALAGPRGGVLAASVRRRFPVAMVDEFQDTDPLQYRIFQRIYEGASGCGFYMIGDPKQAIYGFRGADVFTYIDARARVPEADRFRLSTNWRSSPAFIECVNTLFDNARDPFLFEEITFDPALPNDPEQEGTFRVDGEPANALNLWFLPGTTNTGVVRRVFADVAANRIALLLGQSQATVHGRALTAGDMAVLVRNYLEATAVRDALAQRGIGTAYLTRESVFRTPEAADLALVLQAALEPRNESRVRTALATALVGWPRDALIDALRDERWAAHQERFADYHELWRDRGVLAMLRLFLADYEVPRRMLQDEEGERRLTDVRHLGELVQEKSAELDGMRRILQWYLAEIDRSDVPEEEQRRLETDERLVKVVTLHSAKGLEYELVFLPFVSISEPTDAGLYHERDVDELGIERYRPVLELVPTDRAVAKADRERLAEDLRLLYVGLTRAKQACWVGVTNFRSGGRGATGRFAVSALGHVLLQGAEPANDQAILERLHALARRCGYIGVEIVSDDEPRVESTVEESERALAGARKFSGHIDRRYRISSYSSLVVGRDARVLEPGTSDEAYAGEIETEVAADFPLRVRFPRGAHAGVFLHRLLELWPRLEGDAENAFEVTTAELRAYGFDDVGDVSGLMDWMETVRTTPLNDVGVNLKSLTSTQLEMEFNIPLAGFDTTQLWRLLDQHGYNGAPLEHEYLEGLLRGFIDMVFRHDGRFYVLDYKSNFLGSKTSDYDHKSMSECMSRHRYDLQFLIYTVALRRLLKARLGSRYDDELLGGAYYLFLRGMDGSGKTGVWQRRPSMDAIRAMDALFAGKVVADELA